MIHHIAMWVSDLEKTKDFYVKYFGGIPNELHRDPSRQYQSYFISFEEGSELELMQMPAIDEGHNCEEKQFLGITHLAFSVGSEENVDKLTKQIIEDGYTLNYGPKRTGDGFYESSVFDPELNRVEITT